MGIYDRDYYREDSGWNNPFARARGTVFLCLFYIIFFVAQIATLDPMQQWANNHQPTGLTEFLQLDVNKIVRGEVWRLLTYAFVHHPQVPWHVIVTVVFLAWIGHRVEDIYGTKEYLCYFLAASLFGGIAYMLVGLLGPEVSPLRGPSGAVSAILILYALHYPSRTINVFFVIPVPIWIIVGLYAFQDVMGVAHGANPSLVAVHIAGATFAFLHHTYTLRISNWLPRFNRPSPRRPANQRLRLYQERPQPEPAATASHSAPIGGPAPNPSVDEHLEAKLDEVLEKVSQYGQESLTDAERDILKKASEIYKKRRQSN